MTTTPEVRYSNLLREVVDAANHANDVDDIFERTLYLVCAATGWVIGHALVCESDGQLESTTVWYVADSTRQSDLRKFQQVSEARRFSNNVGLPGRVLVDNRPKWITSLKDDGNFPRQAAACTAQLTSSFAFPLFLGEVVVGVLEFFARMRCEVDEELLDAMTQVGTVIGSTVGRQRQIETAIAGEQKARTLLDAALDSAVDAFIGMDRSGRIIAWNKAAAAIFGWPRNEAIGRILSDTIIPQRYRDAHGQAVCHFRESAVSRVIGEQQETVGLHRDGHELPIEITRWWLKDGQDINFYAFVRDVTERNIYQRKLERQAHYDPLTGLPNRRLLLDRLRQLLVQRDRPPNCPTLLFIDVDNFKRVNDDLGHAAGDHVLITVGQRLRQTARP